MQDFEEDQLDMPVMVDIDDEFYPTNTIEICDSTNRLEDGHPYITVT
jgi:hypothetical protein|tara:strand:+ start:281 stop:421 length:141 start_codon:yes stop_codon:yes gene_type:complete